MKERTRKMATASVSALCIVFLATTSFSAAFAAAPPDRETFEAILWGGLTEPERSWIDGHGILHIRGMVIEYTGIPGPGGPPYWYPGAITDLNLNIIGTAKITTDCDIDLYSETPTGNGRSTAYAEITLYGQSYEIHASGRIVGFQFSIPFVMVGKEGSIKGTATGTMGYPAVVLSGTWIR